MIDVLLSLNIVLKENLDLVVHLWSNVLEEEAGNDSKATKSKGRKSNIPDLDVSGCILVWDLIDDLLDSLNIALHKRSTSCSSNSSS